MATFQEISEAAEVKTGSVADLIGSATKGQVSFARRGDKLVSNVEGFGFTEGQLLSEQEAISGLQLGGPTSNPEVNALGENLGLAGFASSALPRDLQALEFKIETDERDRERIALEAIRARFSGERTRIQEQGLAREGGVSARGRVTGGTGSGLGASTILTANRELVRQSTDKALGQLALFETRALAEGKIETIDRIREQIDATIQADLDAQDKAFERQLDIINVGIRFSAEQRLTNAEQFNQSLDTAKFNEKKFQDEQNRIEKALDKIGYAIDPQTGELKRTVDALNIEEDNRRADLAQQLKESHDKFQEGIDMAKLAISQGNLDVARGNLALRAETEGAGFKFSNDDTGRLINSGFGQEQIDNLQTNLQAGFTLDEILEHPDTDLTDQEQTQLRNILRGTTPTQELTGDQAQPKTEEEFQDLVTDSVRARKDLGFDEKPLRNYWKKNIRDN